MEFGVLYRDYSHEHTDLFLRRSPPDHQQVQRVAMDHRVWGLGFTSYIDPMSIALSMSLCICFALWFSFIGITPKLNICTP